MKNIERVIFDISRMSISVLLKDGKALSFLANPPEEWAEGDEPHRREVWNTCSRRNPVMYACSLTVSGDAVVKIASTVKWRKVGQPALRKVAS